jgi:hypothetical protein
LHCASAHESNIDILLKVVPGTLLKIHGLDDNLENFSPLTLVCLEVVLKHDLSQVRGQVLVTCLIDRQHHPRIYQLELELCETLAKVLSSSFFRRLSLSAGRLAHDAAYKLLFIRVQP